MHNKYLDVLCPSCSVPVVCHFPLFSSSGSDTLAQQKLFVGRGWLSKGPTAIGDSELVAASKGKIPSRTLNWIDLFGLLLRVAITAFSTPLNQYSPTNLFLFRSSCCCCH